MTATVECSGDGRHHAAHDEPPDQRRHPPPAERVEHDAADEAGRARRRGEHIADRRLGHGEEQHHGERERRQHSRREPGLGCPGDPLVAFGGPGQQDVGDPLERNGRRATEVGAGAQDRGDDADRRRGIAGVVAERVEQRTPASHGVADLRERSATRAVSRVGLADGLRQRAAGPRRPGHALAPRCDVDVSRRAPVPSPPTRRGDGDGAIEASAAAWRSRHARSHLAATSTTQRIAANAAVVDVIAASESGRRRPTPSSSSGRSARRSPLMTTSPTSTTRRRPSPQRATWTTTSIERVSCCAHGRQRPRRRRLHDQRLESVEDVEGAVGVTRRPRAVVAGVQRLDEGEHLGATHFSDDQAVGTQPQRGAHELLERDRWWTVDGGRAGLEPEEVHGGRQQLGGVLDRHDPLTRSHATERGVEQRRLASRRGAADDHVAPRRRRAGR